jgi:rare lipoprotein A
MNQLTAAHRDLPFGTRLQIRCPENGRSVLVRINDRGPFIAGRDLDLSLAAARRLGIERRGLARVEYERLAN